MLNEKKILLGVTGSIAAYKAADILRRLKERGVEVRVVMTESAARFVTRLTFETLSEQPVLVDEFKDGTPGRIGHIEVTDGLDCALIAPATANIIGKLAAGIADDTLTSALMALDCPLIIAPAMNERMYRNPVLQRNIHVLKEQGAHFIEPETGSLACGVSGCGRLADTETIVASVVSLMGDNALPGKTIVVTAGPTREPLDAVRFISSPSSGKMGFALAGAARDRGAQVILISGPTQIRHPDGIECIHVRTAADMRRAVMEHAKQADAVIMAAAVSDFRPVSAPDHKVKKDEASMTLELERTEDILADLDGISNNCLLVGFAAETDSVVQNAKKKQKEKNLDMIIANDVRNEDTGFESDTNRVTIIERSGVITELPLMAKSEIASRILDKIVELMVNRRILP